MNEQVNDQTPVRIGMLSFAHGHAYSYASALTKLPAVELVGIYDADAARGQGAAEQFATTYSPEVETLLDEGLDGVIICSENAHHARLAHIAAPKTHNILCEKPIATTLADAQAMIAHCHATGTQLQIAFPVRFAPPIQELKDMLDRKELGEIYCVKCTNHGTMPGGWFVDPTLAGGGAIMDHTVHVIDLLRWFWKTEVVELYAEVGTKLLHPDRSRAAGHLNIDDAGLLSFQLDNGVYGTLDTSWSRPPSYPTWGDVNIEVVGEKGIVTVEAFRQVLTVNSNVWEKTRWIPWGSDIDLALITSFVEMIRTGRAPFISGEDGLRALEVALAAYQSAASQRPITLAHVN